MKKDNFKSQYEQILERNKKRFKRAILLEENQSKKRYSPNKYKKTKTDVIFKIIGHRKSYSSLKKTMNYIIKEADNYVLENDLYQKITKDKITEEITRFNLLKDEDNIDENSLIKIEDFAKAQNDRELNKLQNEALKTRQIFHACFSLPNNKNNSEVLKMIVHKVVKEKFFGHKYILGTHSNSQNTHCHIIVQSKNAISGKQVTINPIDVFQIRKKYDEICKEYKLDLKKTQQQQKTLNLPSDAKKSIPRWMFNYRTNQIKSPLITAETRDYLLSLGLTQNKQINLFTSMYEEHKEIAKLLIETRPDLFELEKGVNVLDAKINIIKPEKRTSVEEKTKYKAPFWFEMYNKKNYPKISADNKTIETLKDIGLSENNMISFLHLYKENKQVAINIIKNNAEIFSVPNNKKFNLPDITFIEYEKIEGKEVKKLPEKYKKEVPIWSKMYQKNQFPEIIADDVTMQKLQEIKFDDNNIKSFLHMYKENPRLAVWTVNKNKKLFNIPKDVNTEQFTLRKIAIRKENKNIIKK